MRAIKALVMGVILVTASNVPAGDQAAGKTKSATCAACHGLAGVSSNPLWPNLAGQKDQYLVKQLKAFRDGQRQDPLMAPMAAGLSDQDIDDLAAFYASQ